MFFPPAPYPKETAQFDAGSQHKSGICIASPSTPIPSAPMVSTKAFSQANQKTSFLQKDPDPGQKRMLDGFLLMFCVYVNFSKDIQQKNIKTTTTCNNQTGSVIFPDLDFQKRQANCCSSTPRKCYNHFSVRKRFIGPASW